MSRGLQEAKKMEKYQELLECTVMRSFHIDHKQRYHQSLGTPFLRDVIISLQRQELNGRKWTTVVE